ncbi:MAG: hypothetical protein IPL10_16350 [Bacteroidetes bacterium]|nr:hypothetical protein [Bacteroidota bacterium]
MCCYYNPTNTPPTASAGLDYTVPISTAYILEGTASDINGTTSLTCNWSQNDPTPISWQRSAIIYL